MVIENPKNTESSLRNKSSHNFEDSAELSSKENFNELVESSPNYPGYLLVLRLGGMGLIFLSFFIRIFSNRLPPIRLSGGQLNYAGLSQVILYGGGALFVLYLLGKIFFYFKIKSPPKSY